MSRGMINGLGGKEGSEEAMKARFGLAGQTQPNPREDRKRDMPMNEIDLRGVTPPSLHPRATTSRSHEEVGSVGWVFLRNCGY